MENILYRNTVEIFRKRYARRELLRNTAYAGGAALAFSVLSSFRAESLSAKSAAQPSDPLANDINILNYALFLEYLEAAAYKAINDMNVLTGRANTYFRAFGQHEQDHVDAIAGGLRQGGATPIAAPTPNFSSVPRDAAGIVRFFQGVEDVGASAYLGAAPSITNADILEVALAIHAVEAEHTAALADLVAPGTDLFAPTGFPMPRTPAQVVQVVTPLIAPGMPSTGGGGMASKVYDGMLVP